MIKAPDEAPLSVKRRVTWLVMNHPVDSAREVHRSTAETAIGRLLDAGDMGAAAAEILRQYGATILSYLVRVLKNDADADDAFGDFKEDLWRGISTFRRECPTYAWAYKLAHHAAMRFRRRNRPRRVRRLESEELEQLKAASRTSERRWEDSEAGRLFGKLKAELTVDEQTLITLHVYERLTHHQIADLMGVRHDLVRKRWSRLIEKLRRKVQEAGG